MESKMATEPNKNPPFEAASPGSFLMFEVDNQVLGFPYGCLGSFSWMPSPSGGEDSECLQFLFGNHKIQVKGTHLKRLLVLLHKQELFLVRVGESKDPKFPKITQIESHLEVEEDV